MEYLFLEKNKDLITLELWPLARALYIRRTIIMEDLAKKFLGEMKNRNYARSTEKMYFGHIQRFIDWSEKHPAEPEVRIPGFLDSLGDSYTKKQVVFPITYPQESVVLPWV